MIGTDLGAPPVAALRALWGGDGGVGHACSVWVVAGEPAGGDTRPALLPALADDGAPKPPPPCSPPPPPAPCARIVAIPPPFRPASTVG